MSIYVELTSEFSYADRMGKQSTSQVPGTYELRSFRPLQLSDRHETLIPSDPETGCCVVIVDSADAADVGPNRPIATRNRAVQINVPYNALKTLTEAVCSVKSELHGRVIALSGDQQVGIRERYANREGVFADVPRPAPSMTA